MYWDGTHWVDARSSAVARGWWRRAPARVAVVFATLLLPALLLPFLPTTPVSSSGPLATSTTGAIAMDATTAPDSAFLDPRSDRWIDPTTDPTADPTHQATVTPAPLVQAKAAPAPPASRQGTSPTPKPRAPVPPIGDLQAALDRTGSGHTLDAGGQSFALSHLSIPAGVTLADARITYHGGAGGYQTAMIDLQDGSGLRQVVAIGGPYAVVRVWDGVSGAAIVDSDVSAGPALGILGYGCSGLRVTGTRIHGNNSGAGDPGNEAGGIKLGACSGVTISGDQVDHNGGPGIWADVGSSGWTISHNRVHHNTYAGIMYEISRSGAILDNAVWENGWGDHRSTIWGAGILVSSSGSTRVSGNIVAWSQEGISFISQNRGVSTSGDSATGNLVAVSGGRTAVGYFTDWGDPAAPTFSSNSRPSSSQLAAAGIPTAPASGH